MKNEKWTEQYLAHVISHTHWDREWYRTVEQYRFRLVKCLDRAIRLLQDEPAWHSFFLDGQTQALIDYTDVCPGKTESVKELVRCGKLRIGPWCVQPDEQLIGGEATLRNLILGRADCRLFGRTESVGYLADNFGHTSQLPQVLLGFGLDNAIFWRGYDENHIPGAEVNWRGADGSTVLAILLTRGYSNAAGFAPCEPEDNCLSRNLPTLKRLSLTRRIAITDGIDHAMPASNLSDVLDEMRRRFPDLTVSHSSWEEFLADVRGVGNDLPELQGELLWVPGLDSTLSNRLDQKQANAYCESLLTSYAEPLAAHAHLSGRDYPEGFLNRAWRMMVKNAAHDSIGGAHTDAVARDVEHRYERVKEIGYGVAAEAMDSLIGIDSYWEDPVGEGRLAVYNPSPFPRSGVVECRMDLPDKAGRDWLFEFYFGGEFSLYDGMTSVPVHILEDSATIRPVYHERINPTIKNTRTLRFLAEVTDLPPLGIKTFDILPGKKKPSASILVAEDNTGVDASTCVSRPDLVGRRGVLRNESVEVAVHPNGSFDLTVLSTGATYSGLNTIIDEQDAGNQYSYGRPRNRALSTVATGKVSTVLNSELRGVVRVDSTIALFDERQISTDTLERRLGSSAPTVDCPISIEIGLSRGSELVDIVVTVENLGAGHRLRSAVCPVAGRRLRVKTMFDLVDRTPEHNIDRPRGVTQAQMDALGGSGMQGFLTVDNGSDGMVLAAHGLYEYKHEVQDDMLYLTLLRSAGTINIGFEGWGSSESGYMPGTQRMKYAIRPFGGDLFATGALAEVDGFLNPTFCRQYPSGESIEMSGPYIADSRLFFSTLKKAEGSSSLIFRFYNVSEDEVETSIPLGYEYDQVWTCRMDETREELIASHVDEVTLKVSPKRVVTLELLRATV